MTCLKDETIAALARGVIPQGELGRIQAHLPECPRCLDAVARRSRGRASDAGATPPPRAMPPAPAPTGSAWLRWTAVVTALLTVALCGLWVTPPGNVRARVEGAWGHVASAAREAASGAEARHVWRALRGTLDSPSPPRSSLPAESPAPATSPAPAPESLLPDDLAASARIAEASRLVERANAAAAANHAAGGP